jgi:hypothetical protein
VAASPGEVEELVADIQSDGKVQLHQSIGGAVVSSGALSAANALPAAWGDTRLYLNAIAAASAGQSDYAEVKIVKRADVVGATAADIMDELRAFELSASGEVIS